MKRRIFLSGLAAGAASVLGGCVKPTPSAGPANSASGDKALEVQVFQGGFGKDFFEQAAREYEQQHSGTKVTVDGNPRVWEQLRPRFVGGKPPGLCYPGWGFDHYSYVYENQILPLDEALDGPAYGGQGKWRDTFHPDVLKMGQHEGKTYMLPYFVTLNGWWYNVKMFRDNGWQVPRNYDEFQTVARQIKAKGIAPLTHQGQYPYYALQGFFFPWAISLGGLDVFKNAVNLVPGAWKSPDFLEAATMLAAARKDGFFLNGSQALSHTEAQMEFLQGRAAMIPCGTWLRNEMKDSIPPGFEMDFMRPPHVGIGHGDPTTIQIGTEPWVVPVKGQNHELAIDFFKYLTSADKAKQFVREKGTAMAIRGADQTEIPPHLVTPMRIYGEAKATWDARFRQWYPTLGKEAESAMAAVMDGSGTPQQMVDRMEKAAQAVRNDPKIPKHTI